MKHHFALSPREQTCSDAAAAGLTLRGTANRLGISRHTVHNIRKAACRRLGVHKTINAVVTAYARGEIT